MIQDYYLRTYVPRLALLFLTISHMQPGYLSGQLGFSLHEQATGDVVSFSFGVGLGVFMDRVTLLPVFVPCSTQLWIFLIELQCDVAILRLPTEDIGDIDSGEAKSDDDDLDRPTRTH